MHGSSLARGGAIRIAVAGLSAMAIAASGCSGDSDPEAKVRATFKKTYGTPGNEAPWYHHVTGIEVANGRLEVTTELDRDKVWYESVRRMCAAAFGVALDLKADEIESGAVIGSDGVPIIQCA